MSKFYISDLHFGHENVIRHDNRPFKDVEQMNKALIMNWNNAVNYDDEVFVLGDFAWKNSVGVEALQQMKGKKFLIIGNHDKITEEVSEYFEWVKDYAVVNDGVNQVILCHYPIAHYYNQYRGSVHLYGHVHNTKDYTAFLQYGEVCKKLDIPFECYNVGCMMTYMNYSPKTLDEIRTAVK